MEGGFAVFGSLAENSPWRIHFNNNQICQIYMMKKLVICAFALALAGCGSSNSGSSNDNGAEDFDPVKFEVSGNTLVMNGVIDSDVKSRLTSALDANPDVTSIVMQNVEGSADDDANLDAARLVRERQLDTLVPSDGLVASGGTDFFLSGVNRIAQQGAKIGVHSWSGGGIDKPNDLPKDHIEHQKSCPYTQITCCLRGDA